MASSSNFDREASVSFAKLAEQVERYDDMTKEMKNVAKAVEELTAEEKALLSVGYIKSVRCRQASCKKLSSLSLDETNTNRMIKYTAKVEEEISDISRDILSILDQHLIPSCKPSDHLTNAFYHLLKGDSYRFLCDTCYVDEAIIGITRNEASDEAYEAYKTAKTIATSYLPPAHLLRLGVALNYSNFLYEIRSTPVRACIVAELALNEARPVLRLNEEHSIKTFQKLEKNYTLWKAKMSRV